MITILGQTRKENKNMTPHIPLRRCRKCLHYRRETCQLPDLDPCNFAPINGKTRPRCWARAEVYIIAALAIIAVTAIFFACRKTESKPTESDVITIDAVSAVELLRNQHRNELSNFDKLIMAIAYTESRFNPDADSGQGDRGLLQLREIYISEVNRLYGTSYTVEDAFDADKSLAIFRALQAHYNPTKDIGKGIYYHNKSSQYRGRVMEVYEMVERYETIRAKLIEK